MNFEISAKEYRDLLDILHIADVIMSGHRKEEDVRSKRHRVLIQKLYALARDEGLASLISYNEGGNTYLPTAEFEQGTLAHAVIDEFGDHFFWDELISRLSVRDAAQFAGGTERFNAMSDSDRHALEGSIRQRYIEEFAAHGIANLTLIERFGIGGALPAKTSD